MNAKYFLAQKGIYNLDTKKRYNEVIAWMEEYAALRQPPVVGRSEQLACPVCKSKKIEIRYKEQSFKCKECKEGWAN